jgi:lipoprotein-anchoring transpeptidase ErfK/SrfK
VPVAPLGVAFPLTFPTRSMVIDTGERKLYYVLPDKKAYAYPISVGREGFDWTGTETQCCPNVERQRCDNDLIIKR